MQGAAQKVRRAVKGGAHAARQLIIAGNGKKPLAFLTKYPHLVGKLRAVTGIIIAENQPAGRAALIERGAPIGRAMAVGKKHGVVARVWRGVHGRFNLAAFVDCGK